MNGSGTDIPPNVGTIIMRWNGRKSSEKLVGILQNVCQHKNRVSIYFDIGKDIYQIIEELGKHVSSHQVFLVNDMSYIRDPIIKAEKSIVFCNHRLMTTFDCKPNDLIIFVYYNEGRLRMLEQVCGRVERLNPWM